MEEVCIACLSTGRKVHFVGNTECFQIYLQILNEIPVFDFSHLSMGICWECHAILHNFKRFKEKVKHSYEELILHKQQGVTSPSVLSKLSLIKPSRLQIQNVNNFTYPQEIKIEPDFELNLDVDLPMEVNLSEDQVKNEEFCEEEAHCEPETFVNNLDLENLREKAEEPMKKKKENKIVKEKKVLKETKKKKTKKKPNGKKKSHKLDNAKKLDELGDMNGFSDVDTGFDNCEEVNDAFKEESQEKSLVVDTHDLCQCEYCEKTFKNLNELETHIRSEHVKIVAVVSDKDNGKVTSTKGPRVKRVKEVLDKKPTCVDCGKVFSSKKTYRYHRNVLHQGQNRYPCPRCGKVYQWKSNLGRHMRSHKALDSGELHCAVCDKRFASIATYRQHLRVSRKHVAETDFSFMCNECGKRFVNKTRLRDHIDWEHLHKVKFRCQECDKPFKCHTSLYVHAQNVHRDRGRRDNLCHVCGKAYQNAAKLKYHIVAMHTSETPHSCAVCGAAFGWYSSLYRHVREVHYKMKLQSKKTKRAKRAPTEMPPPPAAAPQQLALLQAAPS